MLLLEVGLGGRLDATNVIERPLASVITPVSIDHVEFLGDTLEKIAAEKAGILKRGVPAVIAPQPDAAARGDRARSADAGRARRCTSPASTGPPARSTAGSSIRTSRACSTCRRRKLFGRHQFDNAGTAIAALRAAGIKLPVAGGRAGADARRMAGAPAAAHDRPACRARAGRRRALARRRPQCRGGRAVAAALADLEERVSRPLVLIVGMLATKDRDGFLRNFTGLVRARVRRADPSGQGRAAPDDRRRGARGRHSGAMPRDGIEDALAAIGALGFDPPPRILITGSLYLAGEVLARNGTPPV